MHYKIIANFTKATGNIKAGFVDHVEDGGMIGGKIYDENGNEKAHHCSTTLAFLVYDLLNLVNFNEEKDTYEKNW